MASRDLRSCRALGVAGDAEERPAAAASGVGRRAWIEGSTSLLLAGGCGGALTGPAVEPVPGPRVDEEAELRRIAFGSCLHQDGPQSIRDGDVIELGTSRVTFELE